MRPLRFNNALRLAAERARDPELPASPSVGVVRDIYGRLRFAVDAYRPDVPGEDAGRTEEEVQTDQIYPIEAHHRLVAGMGRLGAFGTPHGVLYRDDFSNPATLFQHPDWHVTVVPGFEDADGVVQPDISVRLLDRQVVGQDWLRPPNETPTTVRPHRVVFYGLKGGVGRSTALAMTAYGLARQGKRVLLVDFDLESPGLSGLLLPPERIVEFGLVDWFIEDAVGQGEAVLRSMVSASPLSETTQGAIRVAAAVGQSEPAYLDKLARAYADAPSAHGPQTFGMRMRRVLELLEAQEQPDVVLIDSRAGLHDLAAVSITSLADTALLFATDGAQNWLGYRQLFMHWQRRPEVCAQVRDRLAIVRALAPQVDRERRVRAFQEHAYDLFSTTLYDEIAPGAEAEFPIEAELFHPAMEDEAAPHFPILVDWDERFQEFDPRVRPEQGGVSDALIDATFGALINWVKTRVTGD